ALRDLVGGGRTVLLADARNFPDAVAAGGYAAAGSPVPLLLTPGGDNDLHPAARQALADLRPDRIVLLGGRAALSGGVERAAAATGVATVRVAGPARDHTAAEIARQLWGRTAAGQGYGFVAADLYDPELGWAGALAAASLAATAAAPLLALNPALDARPPEGTAAYLAGLDFWAGRPGYGWVVGPAPDGAVAALAGLLGSEDRKGAAAPRGETLD
ncbi:MAG TPA: cell wall-binding repeat-containing protein, partial [Egibacteraceae bacterium]|nr:cell wall-binding repeat-containing protein [Egibacteraceae bacterium]